MQAGVDERAQRIIHKAVLDNPAAAGEGRTADAHPKMCAVAQPVGAGMTGVRGAFIQHLQDRGSECGVQRRGERLGAGNGWKVWVHGHQGRPVSSVSVLRWRAMYTPWPMMNTTGKT